MAEDNAEKAEPEPVFELIDGKYDFVKDDVQLRAFIAETMANADVDGGILVGNMERVFKWVKAGTVPRKARSGLRVVSDNPHGEDE